MLTEQAKVQRAGLGASMAVHATALTLLVLVPLLSRQDLPAPAESFHVSLPAPPPPPPLPPPRGSPLVREASRPPAKPDPQPVRTDPVLSLPHERVEPEVSVPQVAPSADVVAAPDGDAAGVPEGMQGGVRDGAVGGVPEGTPRGEIGGTGRGPVLVKDYDRPPRLITRTQPVYPADAFTKKIEGTVVVEIVIGADGQVLHARVLRSIPSLDAAALSAVRQWRFAPAMKNGVPVATSAVAPVSFRIY